jgi:cobalt-zinc-cadmium efflux system membrane fusion protein
MTIRTLTAYVACFLAVACGSEEAARPAGADRAARSGEAVAAADESRVRIEEGMLRDFRVTVHAVESRAGGEEISLPGELAVDQRTYAEVGVPLPARVTRLRVSAGEHVRAEQTLAELTSPDLGRARAEYLSAEARVKLADAALERKRGLAAERIAPLREVQEAESAAAEARAALRAARAAVVAFGVDPPGSDTTDATSSAFVLRSPVAGIVIDRAAFLGQMLDPATPAFRVADLSVLWLTVHAFERDALRIESGVTARVAFPALPGRDFQGTVTMVGRSVDRESRTVPVRIDVRNPGAVLRPGMSATAAVPVGGQDESILIVPLAAVQRVRDQWCVFLPEGEGRFEIRRIGRGRDFGNEVEILSGLRAGETVVVDGSFLLKAHVERAAADHDAR